MIEAASLMLLLAIALMARGNPFQFAPALAGFPSDCEPPKPERKAWEDLMMFKKGGGGSSAPAPDPQIGQAAVMQAQTGQDWLNFAKEQFAVGNERQAVIDELTGKVTEAQLKGMNDANDRADQQWKRYQEVFLPAQDKYIEEAMNWDSKERQDNLAAEAKADVLSNAAAAKQSNARNMASMGVSPTSGRYAGVDRATDLGTALAAAGAQNTARNQVRTQGLALKEGVANMAQGATSTSAQQSSLGLNSGNSATGNINAANGQWQANNQIMGQGFQGAMAGYAGQANTLNNLGVADLRQGRYRQAASHLQEALTLSRETGDRTSEAEALNGLGEVLLATGQPGQARTQHAAALDLAAQIGDKDGQARAHNGLGHAHHDIGDPGQARHHWQEALTRYTAIGAPEAGEIRARLARADDRSDDGARPAEEDTGSAARQ